MRVLHLTLSTARGGRRDVIMTLTEQLRRLGVECGIGALRDSPSEVAPLTDRADFIEGFGLSGRPRWRDFRRILKACRRHRVDVIHVHDHASQYVASILRCMAPSLGTVMTFHRSLGLETDGWRNRIRNAATAPLIQAIVTPSQERREYLLAKTLVRRKKVLAIPTGIDLDRFFPAPGEGATLRSRLGLAPETVVALAIGHFGSEKGIDQVLAVAAQAARHVGDRPWHLAILGTGPDDRVALLHGMAASLLPGKVTWAGFQSDVVPWLQGADLLVHAPRQEAFGLVIVQAMACALPTVGMAVGGVPELVVHEETGLLAPPGAIERMGMELARLINEPAIAHRMGERALGRALQHYDVQAYARQHVALYRRLVHDAASTTHRGESMSHPVNSVAQPGSTGSELVTIVVVPRDRFSSVEACTQSILTNTGVPFRLAFLDLGYSRRTVAALEQLCAGIPFEIVPCGRVIPMEAFRNYLQRITTKYTCWVDNDTFVTPGWMTTMLERAEHDGMQAILPLTFEREGLDIDRRRLPLRVHVSHSELRKVTVGGTEYIFDYKPFRRAAKTEIPAGPWTIDFFELHTFFAETAVLRQVEFPAMVVREHVDIGIQLHRLGIPIWCVPQAEVIFDNIHSRPTIEDLRFFTFRWSDRLVKASHDLFAERWGWRFYNQQFMENWAFRRRVFSFARYCHMPHRAADLVSRVMVKVFRPALPEQLRADPTSRSERVFAPHPTGGVAA